MAQASQRETAANTAVPHAGDHDRVAMLSLKVDGTADQHNPEIIGDKEAAVEAAKRQFTEQAVSAVDVAERGVSTSDEVSAEPDPTVAALKEKHDDAAKAAEKAAEKAVNSLHG